MPLWMLCGLAASMAFALASAANVADLQGKEAVADTVSDHGAMPLDAIDFDIPAQPLAAALNRYAALSRKPALFSSDMVAGRISTAVHGRYAPQAALQRLLEGTGVAVEKIDAGPADVFILKEIEAQQAQASPNPMSADGYPGLVQAGVWRALCGDARTAPGAYRSLLRFRIDAAGSLHDPQLLGSTGDSRRDAALLETLRKVHIEAAPPPDIVQQALTMIILPVDQGAGPSCNTEREGAR